MLELALALPPLLACLPPQASSSSLRLLKRAQKHIAHKHYEEAVTDLRRAIASGADAYACTLHIADLESRRQNWMRALCAAEQAVALAPERLTAYEALMTIALNAGDFERAIAACQTLLKRAPRHLTAHETLGMIYMQAGDVDAALRVLNALLRFTPDNPACHFRKGLLCQHKGEIGAAIEAFCATLYLDPDGPFAEEAREAVEALDAFQLNQILTLGMDDMVFRAQLRRGAGAAASARGFVLSEQGAHILADLCVHLLPDALEHCRSLRVN